MAEAHRCEGAEGAARQQSDGAVQKHWGPSHWSDEGDWVCRSWASPLTCRVGRTLPIRTRPEKPCGVDPSKNNPRGLGQIGAPASWTRDLAVCEPPERGHGDFVAVIGPVR